MNSEYLDLIGRLDRFIRKFYTNQIIRGGLVTSAILLLSLLITSLLEYFGHFSISVRTALFYAALSGIVLVLYRLLFRPLMGFWRIGRFLSRKEAARIIAAHFPDMRDQLLNILELAEMKDPALVSNELVLASIDQKIQTIRPFDFALAVDFRSNLRYLKQFGLVFLVFLSVLLFYPAIVTEGTGRIVRYNTYFEKEAPFRFIPVQDQFNVEKGKDLEVRVTVEGAYVPAEAFILFGGGRYLMKKKGKKEYSYLISNINNDFKLKFAGDDVVSAELLVKVLPAPSVLSFSLSVKVPPYTGEVDKVYQNVGDITVPFGSVCRWQVNGQDLDSLGFMFGDSLRFFAEKKANVFVFSRSMLRSFDYRIFGSNAFFRKDELMKFSMNVIPDQFPSIGISGQQDSMSMSLLAFRGRVSDDYGFTKLAFKYALPGSADSTIWLPVEKNLSDQEISFLFDFATLQLPEGKKVSYYFEVWDNDGIRGAKSSKSQMFEYNVPTRAELNALEKEMKELMNDKLDSSRKLAEKLQRNLKDVKQKALNEKSSDWENSRKVENLLQMHQQLEQNFLELQKQNQRMNQMDRSFNNLNEDILEKQKQIEDLMNSLFDEELKKLMEELKELSKDFDKDKLRDLSDKLDLSYEDLKDQLDKDLELLKRFNVEEKLMKTAEGMKDLAREQERLSKQSENDTKSKEDLLKEQKEQSESFKELKEEYNQLLKDNQDLKEPMDLESFKEEEQQIEQQFQEGEQNLSENDRKKAGKKQKKNSQDLNQLGEKMEKMMQQAMEEEEEENADMLKQILENLIRFSFDQEGLINLLKGKEAKDPIVAGVNKQQVGLRDNVSVLRDSLLKLASRSPEIGAPVNKELLSIEKNIASALENLKDRKIKEAAVNQQFVMTSANNLALMLSEILKQMQQEGEMDGNPSSCQKGQKKGKKKGGGKPSMGDMRGMQQGLKEQMQQMIDMMKNGQGAGKKLDKNAQDKRLAQMMAQQEIFNQMLNEMMTNGGVGSQAQKLLQEIKSLMDQNQKDIVNRNITPETLNRQNQIVTRMLEAEKSENQREVDPKRESREGINPLKRNIADPDQSFSRQKSYRELLIKSQLSLGAFYRKKYKEYLQRLNE